MKISIITACYNADATIERTLKSVINQSYKNIEYIIVDGGSNDKTLEIIESYSHVISKIVSEPDKGIYDALNKGIKLATGDFIGFLHADDAFASLQIVKKIAQLATTCDSVYGDLKYVTENDRVIRHWISGAFSPKVLKRGWMPPHPTLYIKREIFNKIGTFDLDYTIASDYDLILRLLSVPNLKVSYLPEVVVLMRVGGTSNKNISNIIRKSKEDYKAIKINKIGGFYTLFMKNFGKLGQFFK